MTGIWSAIKDIGGWGVIGFIIICFFVVKALMTNNKPESNGRSSDSNSGSSS